MRLQRIIEFRFLLTPLATTSFYVNDIPRKRFYVFGFKIIDLVQ